MASGHAAIISQVSACQGTWSNHGKVTVSNDDSLLFTSEQWHRQDLAKLRENNLRLTHKNIVSLYGSKVT